MRGCLELRFWSKVNKTDYCWEWCGSIGSHGYGQIQVKSNGKWSPQLAHRVSYVILKGPIAANLVLDHLCRNNICVNPEHLEPVAQLINIRRGINVGKPGVFQTHCKRGHP